MQLLHAFWQHIAVLGEQMAGAGVPQTVRKGSFVGISTAMLPIRQINTCAAAPLEQLLSGLQTLKIMEMFDIENNFH